MDVDTVKITIELPTELYEEMAIVATEEQSNVKEMLRELLKEAIQQYLWRKGW